MAAPGMGALVHRAAGGWQPRCAACGWAGQTSASIEVAGDAAAEHRSTCEGIG